jgi:hypothetical protein
MSSEPKPRPPREPDPWECCQSGCDPCIYDRYRQELEAYERALREWEARNGVCQG